MDGEALGRTANYSNISSDREKNDSSAFATIGGLTGWLAEMLQNCR